MNPWTAQHGAMVTHIWGQLRSAGTAATIERKGAATFNSATNTQTLNTGSVSVVGVIRQLRSRSLQALVAALASGASFERTEAFDFVLPPRDAEGNEFTFTPGQGDLLRIGTQGFTITAMPDKIMAGELLAAWVFRCEPA